MPGQRIATDDQQLLLATERVRDRCSKRLTRFSYGLTWADLTPEVLAGSGIHSQDVRFVLPVFHTMTSRRHIPLQHLHVQFVIKQCGTTAESPLECEFAVVVMEIARPLTITVHVEAHQIAVGVEKKHDFAVGYR